MRKKRAANSSTSGKEGGFGQRKKTAFSRRESSLNSAGEVGLVVRKVRPSGRVGVWSLLTAAEEGTYHKQGRTVLPASQESEIIQERGRLKGISIWCIGGKISLLRKSSTDLEGGGSSRRRHPPEGAWLRSPRKKRGPADKEEKPMYKRPEARNAGEYLTRGLWENKGSVSTGREEVKYRYRREALLTSKEKSGCLP